MTQHIRFKFRGREIYFRRPWIMGILNATPDSFSGGLSNQDLAFEHAERLVQQGADIIDIGGESTRPGSKRVGADEEQSRVLPLIHRIRNKYDIPLSIDTRHFETARQALLAGADIINQVDATLNPHTMMPLVLEFDAGWIAMHSSAMPEQMQNQVDYVDVLCEVSQQLNKVKEQAIAEGIPPQNVMFDPGIGFGKLLDHNLSLLSGAQVLFETLQRPLLMGLSRKSWIGNLLDVPVAERDPYSALASVLLPFPAVCIHRVHHVEMLVKSFRLKDALCP